MSADVEMKPFVGGSARDSSHILRIGFEHGDIDAVLPQQVRRSQTSRSSTNYCNICVHRFYAIQFPRVKFHTYHPWRLNPAALPSATITPSARTGTGGGRKSLRKGKKASTINGGIQKW